MVGIEETEEVGAGRKCHGIGLLLNRGKLMKNVSSILFYDIKQEDLFNLFCSYLLTVKALPVILTWLQWAYYSELTKVICIANQYPGGY